MTNCGLVLSREPSEHGTSGLVREQNPYVSAVGVKRAG